MTSILLLWAPLAGAVAVGTCAGYLAGVRLDRWLIARALRRAQP